MHILLVEPDRVLARNYASTLTISGHTVATAHTAQDAVHVADEHMPDVVLVELQLPYHNGVEFLYEFRSYTEWLHIPIIILSFVPPSELSEAPVLTRELGVVQILHKPVTSLAQLCAAVDKATAVRS